MIGCLWVGWYADGILPGRDLAGGLSGAGEGVGCGKAEFGGPALDVGPEPAASAQKRPRQSRGNERLAALTALPGSFLAATGRWWRRAMALLREQKVVFTVPHRGTYVGPRPG